MANGASEVEVMPRCQGTVRTGTLTHCTVLCVLFDQYACFFFSGAAKNNNKILRNWKSFWRLGFHFAFQTISQVKAKSEEMWLEY